jgi:transcriptional regulator with XRE-family HTH domain
VSYAELGAAIGISKVSVHYLEREVNYPHCNTLIALADYFDVSLDYLVGRSDDPARR